MITPAAADQHIAELETENASLRTRVAFLESRLAAQAGGPVQMVRTVVPTVELPTPDEMRRLFAIVSAKWPQATSSRNADDAIKRFTDAFAYLASSVSHSDKRSRFAASAWVDRCDAYLRTIGRPASSGFGAIALAAAALGFSHAPFIESPTGWDIWITEGNYRPAGSAYWRALLAGEPMQAPIETPQKGRGWSPTDNRVRISGGNELVGERKGWIETW